MLTVRIQVIDGTGTFTLSDSQPCRLLTSLHGLRRGQALFVRPLLRYYDPVRILIRLHAHRSAIAFMNRPGLPVRTRMRLPRFRAKNFSTCARSPTARGSSHASHSPWDDVAFSSTERDRHLGIRPVSQLNTWPVVSPMNASRRPSRDAAHHSGSGRMASPYPMGDFHLLFFASFLAHSESGQKRKCPGSRGSPFYPQEQTSSARPRHARPVRPPPAAAPACAPAAVITVISLVGLS